MSGMLITQDLSLAWEKAICLGKISMEFKGADGEMIRYCAELQDGGYQYAAYNERHDRIERPVTERVIEGTRYIVQYNGYRALRPGGVALAIGRQKDVARGVEACRFYCKYNETNPLSFQVRDPLAHLILPNFRWNAYHNAAFFAIEGHYLWVPATVNGLTTTLPHMDQDLTLSLLEDMLALRSATTNSVLFFNSLHAGATVDHFHIQQVYSGQPLAVEYAETESTGQPYLKNYPARGLAFSKQVSAAEIFEWVDRCQQRHLPFNLCVTGERIYLFVRNAENEVVEEFTAGVVATMELMGKFITADKKIHDELDISRLEKILSKVTIPPEDLLK